MMLTITTLVILSVSIMAIVRALHGPTIYDRILAVNVFGTKTVLLIAVSGFLFGRPDFLDVALVYALINFVSVIGVLRYFEYSDAQAKHKRQQGQVAAAEEKP